MQNIIAVVFKNESDGYQAITKLRQNPITENYTVLQAALVKKDGNNISVSDSFDSGVNTSDDCLMGGLLGALIGVLGGPVGVLLMGSAGALTGSLIDLDDAEEGASLLEAVAGKFEDNADILVAYADEKTEDDLDGQFGVYDCDIIRYDANVIDQEIEEAAQAQKAMDKLAREQIRSAKKAERAQKKRGKKTKNGS